jgi:hypothetical protein
MKYLPTIILLFLILCLSSCKLARFAYYNVSEIDDYKIFNTRQINKDSISYEFKKSKLEFPIQNFYFSFDGGKKESKTLLEILKETKTVGFLIIKKDSILFEKHLYDYTRESLVNSFSTAKSILSTLVGSAIDDGYINSVKDPITRYIPELEKNGFQEVTIENLLQMTSGIKFWENYYIPYADAGNFYYGRNLEKEVSKLKLKYKPGTKYHYSSGDSQLLGLVLKNALKNKTISKYLEEKLWIPLGMEYNASWSLDDKGFEKTFCCINATAIDYAKIGRLYLNKGNWNGKQIVPEKWIEQTTKIDTLNGSLKDYQYNWYLNSDKSFYTIGYKGQHIYIDPDNELVIVRLGKIQGKIKVGNKRGNFGWNNFFKIISRKFKEESTGYNKA